MCSDCWSEYQSTYRGSPKQHPPQTNALSTLSRPLSVLVTLHPPRDPTGNLSPADSPLPPPVSHIQWDTKPTPWRFSHLLNPSASAPTAPCPLQPLHVCGRLLVQPHCWSRRHTEPSHASVHSPPGTPWAFGRKVRFSVMAAGPSAVAWCLASPALPLSSLVTVPSYSEQVLVSGLRRGVPSRQPVQILLS